MSSVIIDENNLIRGITYPTSNPISCFDNRDFDAVANQMPSTSQAGNACANNAYMRGVFVLRLRGIVQVDRTRAMLQYFIRVLDMHSKRENEYKNTTIGVYPKRGMNQIKGIAIQSHRWASRKKTKRPTKKNRYPPSKYEN